MKRFYSPGLVTATFVLFPISLYTYRCVIQKDLMQPIS
ncbi:HXXEE domain-containing protein [Poseidonocella sp. HB161398]|nr:HXXEE domain-containing protein [Poseidonocella sp. HB161398]